MEYRKGPVTIPKLKGSKACPFPPNMPRTQIDTTLFPLKYQPKTRFNLQNLGKWGMILLALSLSAHIFLFELLNGLSLFFLRVVNVYHFSCLFITAGFILSGFAFLSKWRSTGSRTALIASAFSFIAPWWTTTAELLELSGLPFMRIYALDESGAQYWLQDVLTGPLYTPYCFLALLGFVLIAITMIIWAIGVVRIPKPPTNRIAVFTTSLLCCFSAVYLLRLLPTMFLWLNAPALSSLLTLALPAFTTPFPFPQIAFPIPFSQIQLSFALITIPAIILSTIILNKSPQINPEVSPAPKTHKPKQTRYWAYTSLLTLTALIPIAISPFTMQNTFLRLEGLAHGDPFHPVIRNLVIFLLSPYLPLLLYSLIALSFAILILNWYKHATNPEPRFLTRSLLAIGVITTIIGGAYNALLILYDIESYYTLGQFVSLFSLEGFWHLLFGLTPLIFGLVSLILTRRVLPDPLNSQLSDQLEGGPPP